MFATKNSLHVNAHLSQNEPDNPLAMIEKKMFICDFSRNKKE